VIGLVGNGLADIGISEELDRMALPEHLSLTHWLDVPASLFAANGLRRPLGPPVTVYTTVHDPQVTGNQHRQLIEHGLAEHQIRSLPSIEAVKGACAAGLGYGLLPRCAVRLELQAAVLREVDGFHGALGGPVWICQPQDNHRSPDTEAFGRFLQQHTELVRVFLTLN
jgi:DNA-binding transcriptional LysR family regulator